MEGRLSMNEILPVVFKIIFVKDLGIFESVPAV
jgi:hypothetical protein